MSSARSRTLPILLISLCAIAFEVMLTRYFAVASWSEYGYWVISSAMFGYALSGVVLALFRASFLRHAQSMLAYLPLVILFTATAGYHLTTISPFNPIELQNPVLWKGQLLHIGGLYLALLPFYFFSGLYMGLCFTAYQNRMAQLYAADLIGAGIGAMLILGAMFYVHPFYLLCAVLPFPVLAVLAGLRELGRRKVVALTVVSVALLIGCEAWVVFNNQAKYFEYKAIYPILNVEGNRIVGEAKSPKGYYLTLDNFTERRDLSMTNNMGLLGVPDPPRAFGLYKDGNRLASLPQDAATIDFMYVNGALTSLPYVLRKPSRVLLVGTSGGFRIAEAAELGCRDIVALDSDEQICRALDGGAALETSGKLKGARVEFLLQGPQTYLSRTRTPFDLVEVSPDYFDSGRENAYAFSVEAIKEYYGVLSPNGLIAVPAPIRDFPGYAVKVARTVEQALTELNIDAPQTHVLVYRSEWEVSVLIAKAPFTADEIAAMRTYCSERSFDTPFFAGIDPATVEGWNDLPPFTFEDTGESLETGTPRDSIRDQLLTLFAQPRTFVDKAFFNFAPITNDRPFPHYVLRPEHLKTVLAKLDMVPQQEVGYLVNLGVLIQALFFAAIVSALPLVRIGRITAPRTTILRGVVYFACLGLGFLFIEMTLIERLSWVLNDSVTSFAVVLSSMLVWSGLGSLYAGRYAERPRTALAYVAVAVAVLVPLLFVLWFQPIATWMAGMPFVVKCGLTALLVAPVSFVLGMPFSVGLGALRGGMQPFVPMAWSINGAFSVIASPLATLLAVSYGYGAVLVLAAVLYIIAWGVFPASDGVRR
ncbi:MAG TPA: hypothetical protein PKZ01_05260 [Candidatus Hydrogenedentes bacterium]|nr:hypothetical protein [Candidatus Hydrogenedentota bacterium]